MRNEKFIYLLFFICFSHCFLGLGNFHRKGWRMTWPFPPFPNPKHKDQRKPKFNPDNFEDAPL